MAITDAIGTACKFWGLAADVYRGYSDSKHVKQAIESPKSKTEPENWLNEFSNEFVQWWSGISKLANSLLNN